MEFDQVLALRKSIRSYTDEPVSKEDLAALVKAALASSVGKHNDAGYTLCVVTDRGSLPLPVLCEGVRFDILCGFPGMRQGYGSRSEDHCLFDR